MAKIWAAPAKIKEADYVNLSTEEYFADVQRYEDELRQWVKKHSKDTSEFVGKIFKVPYADGHARYMVFGLKPCELIHLHEGDAWDDPAVGQYSAKYIKELITNQERFQAFWNKQVNKQS